MNRRIDLETAQQLLDFERGAAKQVVSAHVASEQLSGAVAVHNMLVDQGVAYLADEVGMGKTYVALGALALFRHFQPDFRVLIVAPKENIQKKWMKEWRNVVAHVVRVEDLQVKALGAAPARAMVKVDSLVDLVTEASNDPDRDFFARLTSFSLPVTKSESSLDGRRQQLLRAIPWLKPDALNAQSKERYKRNFARAVNCALPEFDLVIIDEAHNLKAGWLEGARATRNTVLGCALGGRVVDDEFSELFRGYGRRAKRVLFLSATPIESEVRQLWNQLDLLGFSEGWKSLHDRTLTHQEHRETVRKLLIRRTAALKAGDKTLTKTEYRQEWRHGGITVHDEPLQISSDRQRLAVALIQKKVSELLGNAKHGHSFQVGLLASFESFLQTVRSSASREAAAIEDHEDEDADDALFHRSSEERAATRDDRRNGADIDALNQIAKDHLGVFNCEMPHPKMDAIVDRLAKSFETGEKALVFVRRVASVDELQRKLEERYDQLLFARLRRELSGAPRDEIEGQIENYLRARAATRHDMRAAEAIHSMPVEEESSSADSFFAWFFRGEGPRGVRSGASLAEQMDKKSGAYSTLLEDNYVAALLDSRVEDVVNSFAKALAVTEEVAMERLALAASRYPGVQGKRLLRLDQMRAFQAAALELLSELPGTIGENANSVLRELFVRPLRAREPRVIPNAATWLGSRTLFTELRQRPTLRDQLWPVPKSEDFVKALRERELRREFMSTMIRKGQPIIDLFILIAKRIGTLRQQSRESSKDDHPDLVVELLDRLETQRDVEKGLFNSYYELHEAASKFELLLQLNAPELSEVPLSKVPNTLGKTFRAQKPVAGMAGKVNGEVVKQFRMPGYPLVLITTDLLKEGEDLHTFCSSVYHYGIAWMPSELEQRVGRIDRVGSMTERRLLSLANDVQDVDKLQVFYPHLRETVEVLQLNRVYARLNSFMRMMHEGLGLPPKETAEVSIKDEGLRSHEDIDVILTPLKSAFKVTAPMLRGEHRSLAHSTRLTQQMGERFEKIQVGLSAIGAIHVTRSAGYQIVGEMPIRERIQPFTLLLRSLAGRPVVRCVSPIGRIDEADWDDASAAALARQPFVRIALERNERFEAYDVAIEGDILLGARSKDASRVALLLRSVVSSADEVEERLLGGDRTLDSLRRDIEAEVTVER